jgi:YfiH family protein
MMFMIQPKPNDAFEWTQAAPGLVLRCRPLLELAPHLFTTAAVRLRGDDGEWRHVAEALGVAAASVRLIRQVHGNGVVVARGGDGATKDVPEADIVVSDDPAVAIGVRVADCAPVLLADRRGRAVAAAHAGWRGTLQHVAAMAVRALQERFGTDPSDVIAAIGPSLGLCCGEMGPEVVDAFRTAGHSGAEIDRWFTDGPRGRPHFDLWRANADQLERAGVPPESIHVSRLCTKCRPDVFHSYRAAGAGVGRMVGVIRAAVAHERKFCGACHDVHQAPRELPD